MAKEALRKYLAKSGEKADKMIDDDEIGDSEGHDADLDDMGELPKVEKGKSDAKKRRRAMKIEDCY